MDDVELISREELTECLFTVMDMREDLRVIRRTLQEEDGGEAPEADA